MHTILVTVIFIGAFAVIATEIVHKTVAALAAVVVLLAVGLVEQKQSFLSQGLGIDFNVIFLLIGSIGEKHGFPISFKRFTLYGMPLMLVSVLISTLYVWVRYFVL